MSRLDNKIPPEIQSLMLSACEEDVSQEQLTQLELALREESQARLLLDCMQLDVDLRTIVCGQRALQKSLELIGITPEPSAEPPAPVLRPGTAYSPGISFLSTSFHNTIGFFSQELPFSILIATLITGLGLWFGSLVYVTHHEQFASPVSGQPSSAPRIVNQPNAEYVGCVTNMVDCRGRIRGSDTRDWGLERIRSQQTSIALGDKITLASGLLELTYDSGAKVILQGPATYEVNLHDGGFLAIGKLTAKLEQKQSEKVASAEGSEVGVQGVGARTQHSVLSTQSKWAPNSPDRRTTDSSSSSLFTIKTPTATVTDLGTEFGVEVKDSGVTSTHVFRGIVEVRSSDRNGRHGQVVRLIENEAVQVDAFNHDEPVVRHITVNSDGFVRSEQLKKITQQRQNRTVRYRTLEWPILHKTLVAWVSLDTLDQGGVGIMSLLDMPEWDGIVYDELAHRKWMGGSHGYQRTQKEQSSYPAETAGPDELVQIAAVYDWTTVTLYRNGQKYASFDVGDRHVYKKDMMLLIGKRHLPLFEGHKLPTLAGKVEEARFYDYAMSSEAVASLKRGESSQIPPVGWWTFEDGTARDVTGHFPMGELHGTARISDGKLILDGHDSYLQIPAAIVSPAKSPNGAKAQTLSIPKHKEDSNGNSIRH